MHQIMDFVILHNLQMNRQQFTNVITLKYAYTKLMIENMILRQNFRQSLVIHHRVACILLAVLTAFLVRLSCLLKTTIYEFVNL